MIKTARLEVLAILNLEKRWEEILPKMSTMTPDEKFRVIAEMFPRCS